MNRISPLISSIILWISIWAPGTGQDSLMHVRQLAQLKNYFIVKGLSVDEYGFDDAAINAKLKETLIYDQKAQNKKTAAGVLTGLGIILAVGSLVAPAVDLESGLTVAPYLLLAGVASGVGSIPLWTAAKKNGKARDAAIAEANALLVR